MMLASGAEQGSSIGTGELVLIGLIALLLFLGHAWIYPYKNCGGCEGGNIYSPDRKSFRKHSACDGTGEQRRLISQLMGRGSDEDRRVRNGRR